MPKRETPETRTPPPDQAKSATTASSPLQPQSIRLDEDDWRALEALAKAQRKATGDNVTASGLARTIIRREIRRRRGVSPKAIVIS